MQGYRIQDDKRDITIKKFFRKSTTYAHSKSILMCEILCNKCGHIHSISYGHIRTGNGCPVCSNPPRIVVEGINDIPTVAPWMVKYFQGGYNEAKQYSKSSHTKVIFICPECNTPSAKPLPISFLYSYGKLSCACQGRHTYPNKFMWAVLSQLGVYFEREFSPSWAGYLRYDFMFKTSKKKYIIEMDGGLGHGKRAMYGDENKRLQSIHIDHRKDELAEKHGYQVIRINADKSDMEFIKNNIIQSKLSKIVDLSNIDWIQCDMFCIKNIAKRVCEYRQEHPLMSITSIAEHFGMDRHTVARYLNKGLIFGWWKDSDDNIKLRKKCTNMKIEKPVKITDTLTNSSYVFSSRRYLSEMSLSVLNCQLSLISIKKAIRKQYITHSRYKVANASENDISEAIENNRFFKEVI